MLKTQRTWIEILPEKDAQLLLDYYTENQDHLGPWEPLRSPGHFTLENWQKTQRYAKSCFEAGTDYRFAALLPDRSEVIGVCNFSSVVRGVFQACYLGYSIAKKYEGQGLMQEILQATTEYMFHTVGLHRIMANYIPANKRSAHVLHKLGFEQEGYARRYLQIAGNWEDHILTSKINE
ncbi:MAG: ribosomal protein S5-alanine N-acetyltransferase [Myxococcales bacterium]|nr:ribosomal protein S5-alanine N-acetyltransferase [Myxococcales bacterium]MCB9641989.1 ribosomal protein S5-alanine N-acetyltransferase [Myxococcales bacterium]